MRNGTVEELLSNGIVLGENIAENFKQLYTENLSTIITQIVNSPIDNLTKNFKVIRLTIEEDFNNLYVSISTLINNIVNNISVVIQNITDIIQKVVAKY